MSNQREIKFRQCIWDYDKDCFLEWHYWGFIGDEFVTPLGDIEKDHQQFTGLYDKKGVPIYEGDIVRVISESIDADNVQIIKWHTGKTDSGFSISTYFMFKGMNCGAFAGTVDLEVIGNVHEHPNLLTKEKRA